MKTKMNPNQYVPDAYQTNDPPQIDGLEFTQPAGSPTPDDAWERRGYEALAEAVFDAALRLPAPSIAFT
jgi:hypothetical protein